MCTCDVVVLCLSGTLGNGTLRTYPWGRVPTHPFIVLGLVARGSTKGKFFSCKYQGQTAWWWDPTWCCFGNRQEIPGLDAIQHHMHPALLYHTPKIMHLHRAGSLPLDGAVGNTNGGGIIAMNWGFRLWVPFKTKYKYWWNKLFL